MPASFAITVLAACLTVAPGQAAGLREIALSAAAPSYVARVSSRNGARRLQLRVYSEVRSVDFRFAVSEAPSLKENVVTSIELVDVSESSRREQLIFRGKVVRTPDPASEEKVWRIFTPAVALRPRERDLLWELRLRTVPPKEGDPAPPLEVAVRMEADARPIADRERELMAWRAQIKDPLREIEAVRTKLAELSDEEIRFYTGFKDRASFLKYWGRAKRADFRTPEGEYRLPAEAAGLIVPGNPLPDGRFLHHNGTVPRLE